MKKILLAATAALVLFGATGCKEKKHRLSKKRRYYDLSMGRWWRN